MLENPLTTAPATTKRIGIFIVRGIRARRSTRYAFRSKEKTARLPILPLRRVFDSRNKLPTVVRSLSPYSPRRRNFSSTIGVAGSNAPARLFIVYSFYLPLRRPSREEMRPLATARPKYRQAVTSCARWRRDKDAIAIQVAPTRRDSTWSSFREEFVPSSRRMKDQSEQVNYGD